MTGWPSGIGLVRLEQVDSTNDEARRRAEAGGAEHGPLWITAERQTAGRGRRGRTWQTLDGNLAATLLLRPKASPPAQLSFAAALAVADMVSAYAPQAAVTVKWPNDVLLEGKKLAGILLEAGAGWLAVGVGINLANFPDGTEFPATSVAAQGVTPPRPEAALALLAARFAHWQAVWEAHGFEPLRRAWLARAGGLGAAIRARLPHEEAHGAFEGIDGTGALLLRQPEGLRAITAGEVFF